MQFAGIPRAVMILGMRILLSSAFSCPIGVAPIGNPKTERTVVARSDREAPLSNARAAESRHLPALRDRRVFPLHHEDSLRPAANNKPLSRGAGLRRSLHGERAEGRPG